MLYSLWAFYPTIIFTISHVKLAAHIAASPHDEMLVIAFLIFISSLIIFLLGFLLLLQNFPTLSNEPLVRNLV